MEYAIGKLTEIKIKKYSENKNQKYMKVGEFELIDFCIKLLKLVERES